MQRRFGMIVGIWVVEPAAQKLNKENFFSGFFPLFPSLGFVMVCHFGFLFFLNVNANVHIWVEKEV